MLRKLSRVITCGRRFKENNFDAPLFESCVREAAGSLAVASFFFRGLVPSGVVLGVFWEHLGTQGQRLGSLGSHLGVLRVAFLGSLGLLWGPLGPLGLIWGSFGCLFWGLWESFGVPWVSQ